MIYIDVLLPLYLDKLLTYSVPLELQSSVLRGGRVGINLGKSKVYAGIVVNIYEKPEIDMSPKTKAICDIIDTHPIVTPIQLELWQWIARYYLCTLGEVMKQFLPSSLRLSGQLGETQAPEYKSSHSLTQRKQLWFAKDTDTENILATLKRARTQLDAYACIVENSETVDDERVIWRDVLTAGGIGAGAIRALINRGFINERVKHIPIQYSTDIVNETDSNTPHLLTETQEKAFGEITNSFEQNKTTLLFGAPRSGKIKICLALASKMLEEGKNVLILLPELAVTTQLAEQIADLFPQRTLLYHSRQTEKKRLDTYQRILHGKAQLVVGTRIAVTLPFSELGLIVVIDESEPWYKQYEKRPYFHARDTAVMLGHLHHAKVLLTSTAPSVESFHNCTTGKYSLVEIEMTNQADERPRVSIIDRRHIALKDKQVYGYRHETRYFSKLMLTRIARHIEQGGQTLILHNRRGFASYMECENCGYTPRCTNCNVSLTLHKRRETLECHYCGLQATLYEKCPSCDTKMTLHGIGSENVEETIEKYFPLVSVARIDSDTIKHYTQFKETLEKATLGKTTIIVGTQLIAKSFSFPHSTLACVVNIDTLLNFPDFRVEERTFQLMARLSSRIQGNKVEREMIIQTSQPERDIFRDITRYDYRSMYEREIEARKIFGYPPFTRLIRITLKHEDPELLHLASEHIATALKKELGSMVSGPEIPVIDKIRNTHLTNIMLKTPRSINIDRVKQACLYILKLENADRYRNSIRFEINVDF